MCIILTCDPNKRPTADLLETCFDNNPDGAGVMWIEDGAVQTSKGYMGLDDLLNVVSFVPIDSPLCIHMRIATSGGIDASVCHPFPICDSLDAMHALDVECGAALMHNGIIAGVPTDDMHGVSDTVKFTMTTVNNLFERYHHTCKRMKDGMRRAAPGNRFALLESDGTMTRIGDGWNTVTDGIQASNRSWRRPVFMPHAWKTPYSDADEWADLEYIECCNECALLGSCMEYGPACDEALEELYGAPLFNYSTWCES